MRMDPFDKVGYYFLKFFGLNLAKIGGERVKIAKILLYKREVKKAGMGKLLEFRRLSSVPSG